MNRDILSNREAVACGEQYCFVCSVEADHYGQHTERAIDAWCQTPTGRLLTLVFS